MRIVHLSDTHLGYRQFHKLDPETGVNQREQDVYDAFERVMDRIIELEPDLVIHAGDLFDTVRPTNRAVNEATGQFARLSREEIPTVVIAGNHDTPKMATTGTIMQSLDQLPYIQAVTSDEQQEEGGYRTISVGEVTVHAVSDAPVSDQLRERLESVEPDPEAGWNILVLHAGVREVESEVYSGEFNEHYVTTNLLGNLGMDYVALGHYHKRMRIGEDINARYCGGTERFSFNEANYQPGFLELLLEEELSVTEHEIETRPFIRIEAIDAEGLQAGEISALIEEQLPADGGEGALVSLTVTNLDSSTEALLEEQLLKDLRDRVFESEIRLFGLEGEVSSGENLEFKDLRQEFEDYIDRRELADEEEAEAILETGLEYLARALGEEDEI